MGVYLQLLCKAIEIMKKRTGKTSLLIGMFVVTFIVLTSFKSFSLSPAAIHPYKLKTVVIDPGHGGKETGAIGPAGSAEKELALLIAKTLATRLEQALGLDRAES